MNQEKQVVAYCRISTAEQRKGGGINIQVRDVQEFAEKQGFTIYAFYLDEAVSGVVENRSKLRKLLRDCERGQVGTLIIPALDRLSRDVRIAENLFWRFDQLGIRVLIADMPNYNGQDRRDVLLRQIREAIAEENRKEIIERLWKGRQERVRRGMPPGGTVPYGFIRIPGAGFLVEPKEAEIVRQIFEFYDRGAPSGLIALQLNHAGFTRRNGKPWNRWQVAAILKRREFYERGILRYGEAVGSNEIVILIERKAAA
jgi:site-specific DNA recombinase